MFETKKDRVEFSVNKDIYSDDSIHETVSIFRPNFNIKVEENQETVDISIRYIPENMDPEEIALEFFNHLLSNENTLI